MKSPVSSLGIKKVASVYEGSCVIVQHFWYSKEEAWYMYVCMSLSLYIYINKFMFA